MSKKKDNKNLIDKELEFMHVRIDDIYKQVANLTGKCVELETSWSDAWREVNRLHDRINDVNKILRVHADQNAQTNEIVESLAKDLANVKNDVANSWAELTVEEPEETKENDPVNHPSHYTDGKYETIDFIEDYGLTTHIGNAIKYISRAGKKDEDEYIQDLNKADWYLQRYLQYLETGRKHISVSDYCKEKKLPLELTKVINCLVIGNYQTAHEILREYIDKLKSNN